MTRSTPNKRVNIDPTQPTVLGNHIEYYNGRKDVHNLGAGDTFYIAKFIKPSHARNELFEQLLNEVNFQQMVNFVKNTVEPIPRLVAAQTNKSDPRTAIYRMPGCNQCNIPTDHWTPTVEQIVKNVSAQINQPLNHCIVTLYRDNEDSLAFHQDKIVDLDETALICSVSFGEARPIVFQEIHGNKQQTILLQPGSLLVFGPKTNKHYRHAVPKVNQYRGPRISLSLRNITSFVDENNTITGKGDAHQTVNYPFIKSYDDESEYTDSVKEEIGVFVRAAEQQLENLRSQFNK